MAAKSPKNGPVMARNPKIIRQKLQETQEIAAEIQSIMHRSESGSAVITRNYCSRMSVIGIVSTRGFSRTFGDSSASLC
jgi:hypothetical protein